MSEIPSVEVFLQTELGMCPETPIGWFRAGVAFYNKDEFTYCMECLHKSALLDPNNYNVYQLLARVYIKTGRRDLAIAALKKSIKLNNVSDWQLLVELTAEDEELGNETRELLSKNHIAVSSASSFSGL